MALLMAMEDAERSELPGPIDFRLDSTAVVHLAVGTTSELVKLRHRVMALLARHREWRLAYVERRRNWVADRMARRTLHEWQKMTVMPPSFAVLAPWWHWPLAFCALFFGGTMALCAVHWPRSPTPGVEFVRDIVIPVGFALVASAALITGFALA
jgi:hypothetical protein